MRYSIKLFWKEDYVWNEMEENPAWIFVAVMVVLMNSITTVIIIVFISRYLIAFHPRLGVLGLINEVQYQILFGRGL